jgi:hypothetical protein
MSNDDQPIAPPTPAAAAAALDELAAARRAVLAAERRTLPLVLGASSFLTLVQHAAADHVTDRRTRWLIAGTCVVLDGLVQVGDLRSAAVQPFDRGLDEHAHTPDVPRATWVVAALLRAGVEWSVVRGSRRTQLRWPNTAAGLALAAGTLLTNLALRRLLSHPGADA